MDNGLRDDLLTEIDDVWSETIRHLPLSAGIPDQSRSPVEFAAVLRTGDRDSDQVSLGRGNRARPGLAADGGYLRIDRAANQGLLIAKGDRVVALERAGEPIFEILSVDDRSHLRLICELGDSN